MHRFRTRTARRWFLFAAGCAALTLLGVWIAQRADDDQQRAPQDTTTAPPVSTKSEPAPAESESVSKTDGKTEKASPPPPLPYGGRLVPEGYEWGDPHPWLVKVRGEFHRRYIGPQTAEAIFAVMLSAHPPYQQEDRAMKVLEHYRYALSRGAAIHDALDAGNLAGIAGRLDYWRKDPESAARNRKRFGLPADATLQELVDAEIDHWIKTWPPMREQIKHANKTGEATLNVKLMPDGLGSGAIGIGAVGRSDNRRELTPEEKYNISRHGIAPKGFRLRFVDENENELPFNQVPFFSERDVVKHWSDAKLEEQLVALPTYMNQPEALEQPNVIWMSMVDRYDAALAELSARRRFTPPPSAASGDSAAVRAPVETHRPPPGLRESGSEPPPVQQRETEPPEARAKREAALAAVKAEGVQRVAEAYVEALAELEKQKNISSEAREKLARRILELRALSKAPAAPPASPPDSQGSSSSEEVEED